MNEIYLTPNDEQIKLIFGYYEDENTSDGSFALEIKFNDTVVCVKVDPTQIKNLAAEISSVLGKIEDLIYVGEKIGYQSTQ